MLWNVWTVPVAIFTHRNETNFATTITTAIMTSTMLGSIHGKTRKRKAAKKNMSAKLSSDAPSSVVVFVSLAMLPSSISVTNVST